MAFAHEVLSYLRPNGGYIQVGDDYDGIEFVEAQPFSKKEYEEAFAKVDAAKEQLQAEAAAKKAALLEKLGITDEEAKLLLA